MKRKAFLRKGIRQAAKAGYGLEWIAATPVAKACATAFGHMIGRIPHFIRSMH